MPLEALLCFSTWGHPCFGQQFGLSGRAPLLTGRAALQEVLLKGGRDSSNPAHVVGMVRQAETVEVANFLIDRMGHGVLTAELLQPDELVSGIIAQAGLHLAESALPCAEARSRSHA